LEHVVDPFLARVVTTGLIYFRLHGGKNFRKVFTNAELLFRSSRNVLFLELS
jgi:hypothetical protein